MATFQISLHPDTVIRSNVSDRAEYISLEEPDAYSLLSGLTADGWLAFATAAAELGQRMKARDRIVAELAAQSVSTRVDPSVAALAPFPTGGSAA